MNYNGRIESLLSTMTPENALVVLSGEIELLKDSPDTLLLADAYFCRGRLYWRLGRRAEATSDYVKSADLNPSGPAVTALEQARDIEAFFNPDLYNP